MSEGGPPTHLGFRSVLFLPGHRTDLLPKAVAAAPDAICLDLEDAVPPDAKAGARAAVGALLAGGAAGSGPAILVRINPVATPEGEADLEALGGGDAQARRASEGGSGGPGAALAGVILPKAADPLELRRVVEVLGPPIPLIPLIESAEGLERVAELARAPGVAALCMGGLDLSADLGCAVEWEALLYARSRVVHAAALARIPALDLPNPSLSDPEGLERESTAARRLGFRGKLALHPAQVAPIHRAFTPSPEELERARRIVRAWEEAGGGAVRLDGKMIDAPVVRAARNTLAWAGTEGEA